MRWTPEENKLIRDNWHDMTDEQLAALLPGRQITAIHQHRAVDMGLNRRTMAKKRKSTAFSPEPVVLIGEIWKDKKKGPVWHGTVPANPISRDEIKHIDLLKRVKGTYREARA